ncbi:MAG: hypothetical protein AAFU77_06270 [Myxococcota bacterium]
MMAMAVWVVVAQAPVERLIVLDLESREESSELSAELSEELLSAIRLAFPSISVTSHAELRSLLGQEARRQAAGCVENEACIAEIAGAMDADHSLSGRLAQADGGYSLTLKLLNTRRGLIVRQLTERVAAQPLLPEATTQLAIAVIDGRSPIKRGVLDVKLPGPVMVDGAHAGFGPGLVRVSSGYHTVLWGEGASTREDSVEVLPYMTFELGLADEILLGPQMTLAKEDPWYASWWVLGAGAILVAGAATAAVIATQSDDASDVPVTLDVTVGGP